MKRTALTSTLLAISLAGLFGAPAPAVAATPGTRPVERPSILQAQDLAHRGDVLNLPAAGPTPRAPRAAAASPTSSGLQREVFGFATYWELASGDLSGVQWDKVSTVAYFGLTLNSAGGFDNDGGMTGWNSSALTSMIAAARAKGTRVVLTVKDFSDASINAVVSNPATGQTAINNIVAAIRAKALDGVNVDFEGATSSSYPNLQGDFTNWIRSLSQQVHSGISGSFVTLDAYSGSASWNNGFMRIDTLAPYVDAFFIMGYDMNSPNSLPNAPLGGPYTYTDTNSVDQFLGKVGGDGTKVILGVPYYGYKFSTTSNAFNAPVSAGPATPGYADVVSDIQCGSGAPDNLVRHWDNPSSTPWLSWYSPASGDPCAGNHGSWRETYYDDANSLGAKYELVNARNIRGMGMWALGYDHGSNDLWNAIAQHFTGAKWSGWSLLSGMSAGRVAYGTNADGRMEAFARMSDGTIAHNWQASPNGPWAGWVSQGGAFAGDPQVATNGDGRLEAFAVGTDNQLWHEWQLAPNSGWSAWYPHGGSLAGRPAVGRNRDGRLEVFAQGGDGAVWHAWQLAPSSGWSAVFSLGGATTTDPAVATNADGRLESFARRSDNAVWHSWQAAPGKAWTGWSSLGGSVSGAPATGANADGRLEVFALGSGGLVQHVAQVAPSSGWNQFVSLGSTTLGGDPTVGRDADGRLELFAVDGTSAVQHTWQMGVNIGWVNWVSLGPVTASAPAAVGNNADGRLELAIRGSEGSIWHDYQLVPNGGW